MGYASYIYRRNTGIFYFRHVGNSGAYRFSLRTRNYKEAKRISACYIGNLQQFGVINNMGYDKKSYLGENGVWILPDVEKIKWVRENLADQLDGSEDNRFLVDMFDIYEKNRDAARKSKLEGMAQKFYGIEQPPTPVPLSSVPVPVEPEGITLSELMKRFIDEKIAQNALAEKTIDIYLSRLSLLSDLLGADTDIRTFGRGDFVQCLSNLQHLPAKRRLRMYRGKSTAQLLKMEVPQKDKFKDSALKLYIELLSSLFRYAELNDFVHKNFVQSLAPKKNKKIKARVAYNTKNLQAIIDHTWKKERRMDRRFIPLIAMYSGMRLAEICQLLKQNILEVGGIWCFVVSEDGEGQHVKTDAGIRTVPIHSKLIELGLLDYVNSVDGVKLWPKLKPNKFGNISAGIQQWFGRVNRKHVTKLESKTFHSMRHLVVTSLRNAGVERHLYQQIIGHSLTDTTAVYESDLEPTQAKEIIEKLYYDLNFD